MNTALLEEILACPSLPSLPAVAMRVVELTQREDVSLNELAQTISLDQGLALRILRTVNSSFYGLTTPCASIDKALVMLGLRPVMSLALGFSLVDTVGSADDGFDYTAYWRRALYSATAARLLASRAAPALQEQAFLAALFQDIGMVALHRALGDRYLAILHATGDRHDRLARAEIESLECSHPDVGAMLAQRWRLPDELVIPIRYHEKPTAAPSQWSALCRAVALANLVHDALTSDDPATPLRSLHRRAHAWFALPDHDTDGILHAAASAADELARALRLDAGPRTDAQDVLARARKRLVELKAQEAASPKPLLEFAGLTVRSDRIDPLTGLFTRPAFENAIASAFDAAHAAQEPLAVIQTHVAGLNPASPADDHALITTTAILQKHLDPLGAALCRWATDTFAAAVVGLPAAAAQQTARALADDLIAALAECPAPPRVSVGVAVADARSISALSSPGKLIAAALAAASAARSAGGDRVRAFTPRAAA